MVKKPLADAPAIGSHWRRPLEDPRLAAIKVMGVVDGWVLARRAGVVPFIEHVNQWGAKFIPASQPQPKKEST